MRFRHVFMIIGCVLGLGLLFLSDPDSTLITDMPMGASTFRAVVALSSVFLYVALLHINRKILMDYVDLEVLYDKARESSTGAGLFAIAVAMVCVSLSLVFLAASAKF